LIINKNLLSQRETQASFIDQLFSQHIFLLIMLILDALIQRFACRPINNYQKLSNIFAKK